MPDGNPSHPSAKELSDFGLGRLPRPQADTVASHLETCEVCVRQLSEQRPDSFVRQLRAAAPGAGDASTHARKPPPTDAPPELVASAKFEVLAKLGEGGMGAVWKARHSFLNTLVAIKVMNAGALADADARGRFLQEMRAAGRLDHPNIVRAFDAEQAGGLLLLVMEYVEGPSLEKLVKQKGALPIGFACRCVTQAAHALQHAHEKGMVHRDVKPANLMVTKDKVVKLVDFGLARLAVEESGDRRTRLEMFMGTADFIAPEQALNARDADIRADIYSLGCTLYYLLAGRPPFRGASAHEVAAAHVTEEPPPLPDLPDGLWAVIARMMAKQREDRYQTPADVVAALEPFARRDTVEMGPPPLPPPLPVPAPPRRRRLAVGLTALAAVALLVFLVEALPRREPEKADPVSVAALPNRDPEPAKPPPDPFVPLFNGKDLAGWEALPKGTRAWRVENGVLVGEGGKQSFLFTKRGDYENVHVVARARLRPGGNSGLFVRKAFNMNYRQGYQLELLTSPRGERLTGQLLGGGVYIAQPTNSPPLGEWVDLELIVEGYRLTSKVNGKVTASGADIGRRFAKGRIAVEMFDAKTRVEFSKIAAKELPNPP